MSPDLAATGAFLAALTGSEETPMTFQTFDDSGSRGHLVRTRHGTLAQHASELARLNAEGAGIFVCVNETNLRRRRAEDIVALRALFIDCDKPRIRTLALPTSITVATSGDRKHFYWLLEPGEPLDGFREAQQHLARYYGSDPVVCDLPRVMRLPGFFHRKREPLTVHLIRADRSLRSSIDYIIAAHPLPKKRVHRIAPSHCDNRPYSDWARTRPISPGHRNTTAYSIAAEGVRRGLAYAKVASIVHDYCVRAGIPREAYGVIRSACRRWRKA